MYIWNNISLFNIHFSFPRYLNEVLCDYQDSSCIGGEGAGYQRVIHITFRRDTNGTLGVGKLGDWEDYVQEIRTRVVVNCCQISNFDFLSDDSCQKKKNHIVTMKF